MTTKKTKILYSNRDVNLDDVVRAPPGYSPALPFQVTRGFRPYGGG